MLGVAEKAGSGSDKIIKGWRESNWRPPYLEEQLQPDKVVLTMPMESLLSNRAKSILKEHFGETANTFDHNVLSILAMICDEGNVNNERLRYSLNLHKYEIAELLKLMTQKGLLIAKGYGRGMRYTFSKDKNRILGAPIVTNSATSSANSATSDANSATSSANSATSDANSTSTKKQRLHPEEMKKLIMSVCEEWVTLEEIVTKTGKSNSYLRNVVMPKFLADKTLEMLYPGTPNHPNQKYKLKD